MKKKEIGRLDRFAFALGSVTLMTPFSAIPIIPGDRINAARRARARARLPPGPIAHQLRRLINPSTYSLTQQSAVTGMKFCDQLRRSDF
jgi:hypothetical protein